MLFVFFRLPRAKIFYRILIVTTVIILFGILSTSAGSQFFCTVASKQVCGASGCVASRILDDDYRVINLETNSVMLGRDEFAIKQHYMTGAFDVYELGSGTAFLKVVRTEVPLMDLNKGDFIEQRDSVLTSVLSWGSCQYDNR